jgi:hypothetical protein
MTNLVDDYFNWLVAQIRVPNTNSYGYLFTKMYNLDFQWTVPNDDNRLQDGKDLRNEFLGGLPRVLHLEGVSFLEVLIALSRRLAFTAGGQPDVWAWRLLKNLRLNKMSDPLTQERANRVDDILDTVIWRTYSYNGEGGFFPLQQAAEDQTKVEIWYQLNAYVIEMDKY